MKTKTLLAAAAVATCAFGASAEMTIDLDLEAKPIKDMRQTGYKGVVAGIEMGNESYGRARASRGVRSVGRTRSPASPRGATGTRRSRSPGIAATRRFPRA